MKIHIAALLILLTASPLTAQPVDENGQISPTLTKRFEAQYDRNEKADVLENAVSNNDLRQLALNRKVLINHNTHVNYKLEAAGITNQKSSGRCWIFSGLNIFSPVVAKKLNTSKFEFSQAYLAFWDKMEKANLFFEQVIAFRDRPVDDREMQIILESPFGDGGWWHDFVGLVEKYGVVPKYAMPETKQSEATGRINGLATRRLRGFASELRRMHREGADISKLRERKEEMLAVIYRMLVLGYGKPPTEFEFRYESDDSVKPEIKTYTPQQFRKEFIGDPIPEYVALLDNPNKPYDRLYRSKWNRNVFEHEDFVLLNLPVARLKHYAQKALLDSQLVWFACDVGKEHSSDSAILGKDIYRYDRLFDTEFRLSKADRLAYMDGWASHAMALMGIDTTDSGEPTKWLVENSWGTKRGDDGFWYMYDDWFDEYVYVVVVKKDLLDKADKKKLELTPEETQMWDAFSQPLRELRNHTWDGETDF